MSWQDKIVGARMTVDQEFAGRVQESQFSRQQWGLIMTAVEFRIEDPGDADAARIVADTSKLEHVLPELDAVEQGMGAMGGPGGPGGSRGGGGGGILSTLKGMLGVGSDGGDEQQKAAAEALTQEYATELQTHLESRGRWDKVRQAAAGE